MAAKIPQQYYTFPSEFCSLPVNPLAPALEGFSHSVDYNGAGNVVPLMNLNINSPVSGSSFAQQFVVSECMAVPQMSDIEMGFCDYQHPASLAGSSEECGGLAPNLWPAAFPMANEDWATQGKAGRKVEETTEVKVGRYSVEERKDRILRYLKKRNQRNFNKTIKYACRKNLADKRVRIRGRFAKNNEISEEEIAMKTSHDAFNQQNNSFPEDSSLQMMTCDEDDWLQTAIANLVQLPHLAS